MSHVKTFKQLFGDDNPSQDMKGYILDMNASEIKNPFLLLSRHTGNTGGRMAIKNKVLYVQAPSFDHPDAKQLAV